jgi:hypothetical protein
MSRFETIDPKPWHCGQILRHLRLEHRIAVSRMGLDGHREISDLFDQSMLKRAWTLDGRLAGIAGITGSAISPLGFVWFAMTDQATKYPVAIIREARQFLDDAMITKRELATTILSGDEAAKRLAVFLGFHYEHDGPGHPAYSRSTRKSLSRLIDSNPEIRIPMGAGYAIALGYHLEDA